MIIETELFAIEYDINKNNKIINLNIVIPKDKRIDKIINKKIQPIIQKQKENKQSYNEIDLYLSEVLKYIAKDIKGSSGFQKD